MRIENKIEEILETVRGYNDHVVAVIVHINDTYRIEGFPRLIATVNWLRDQTNRAVERNCLLLVHSGDFLGPSRLGAKDKGEGMVQALNRAGLDYCVLGNHEFDYKTKHLSQRIREANFKVVMSNVVVPGDIIPTHRSVLWPTPEQPLVAFAGIVSESVRKAFPRHGLYGLAAQDDPDFIIHWNFCPPISALNDFWNQTSSVPFHVVLTHADRADDRLMAQAIRHWPRTIILGGHDHHVGWMEGDVGPPIFKNLANLQMIGIHVLQAGGYTALNQLLRSYLSLRASQGREPDDTVDNVDAPPEALAAL